MPDLSSYSQDDVANRIQAAFMLKIGATRFGLWFPPNARLTWLGHELIVRTRNDHFQEWAADNFGQSLQEAVQEVCGQNYPVRYITSPELFLEADDPASADVQHLPVAPANLFHELPAPKPTPVKPPLAATRAKPTRRWKTFNDFIVGASNRVAAAAAQSVVEEPGLGPNPLVIHGPVGSGKTHLLEAIYAGLRATSDLRPVYVTADEFTSRFVQASRFGKMSTFHRRYRESPALLFDDLHQLASRRGSADEFLHTLDALVADGRTVVVTMDCHPKLMDDLPTGLVDRLAAGAAWGLQPPEESTRFEILRHKAAGSISEEVLRFLAQKMTGNVRELEGAVNNLRHFARVTGQKLTISSARDVISDLLRSTVRAITLADVDQAVRTVVRLAPSTLQSNSRSWMVSQPRTLAIYLARKHTHATYSEIAKHFAIKQHSTAVAAEKRVREWLEKQERLTIGDRSWCVADLLDRIERELLK